MPLWMPWWNAIWLLRPAFSRLRTFLWFATAVAGFTVRTELLGVTSLVRALKLEARFYNKLVDHFHSPAVKLDRLAALWTQVVLRLFPQPLRINGRCIVVGDGIKIPKRGRKMPAVKLLHQQSEFEHQARIHHGTFPPGCERARSGRSQRLRRAARHANPRRVGVVQSRSPHPARQDACAPRDRRHRRTLLLRRRRLLCRAQDRHRPARGEQPPGHAGEVQRRRLHRPPAAWPAEERPAQSLWQQGQAQIPAGRPQGLPTGRKSRLRRAPGDHPVSGPRPAVAPGRSNSCASWR